MSKEKGAKVAKERKVEIDQAKKEAKPEPQRFGNPNDKPVQEPL